MVFSPFRCGTWRQVPIWVTSTVKPLLTSFSGGKSFHPVFTFHRQTYHPTGLSTEDFQQGPTAARRCFCLEQHRSWIGMNTMSAPLPAGAPHEKMMRLARHHFCWPRFTTVMVPRGTQGTNYMLWLNGASSPGDATSWWGCEQAEHGARCLTCLRKSSRKLKSRC